MREEGSDDEYTNITASSQSNEDCSVLTYRFNFGNRSYTMTYTYGAVEAVRFSEDGYPSYYYTDTAAFVEALKAGYAVDGVEFASCDRSSSASSSGAGSSSGSGCPVYEFCIAFREEGSEDEYTNYTSFSRTNDDCSVLTYLFNFGGRSYTMTVTDGADGAEQEVVFGEDDYWSINFSGVDEVVAFLEEGFVAEGIEFVSCDRSSSSSSSNSISSSSISSSSSSTSGSGPGDVGGCPNLCVTQDGGDKGSVYGQLDPETGRCVYRGLESENPRYEILRNDDGAWVMFKFDGRSRYVIDVANNLYGPWLSGGTVEEGECEPDSSSSSGSPPPPPPPESSSSSSSSSGSLNGSGTICVSWYNPDDPDDFGEAEITSNLVSFCFLWDGPCDFYGYSYVLSGTPISDKGAYRQEAIGFDNPKGYFSNTEIPEEYYTLDTEINSDPYIVTIKDGPCNSSSSCSSSSSSSSGSGNCCTPDTITVSFSIRDFFSGQTTLYTEEIGRLGGCYDYFGESPILGCPFVYFDAREWQARVFYNGQSWEAVTGTECFANFTNYFGPGDPCDPTGVYTDSVSGSTMTVTSLV